MIPTPPTTRDRRRFLQLAAAGIGSATAPGAFAQSASPDSGPAPGPGPLPGPGLGPEAPFSQALLRRRARTFSRSPWRSAAIALPPALEALDYDGMRDIRYVRERNLWHGRHDFNVEFFHLGDNLTEPVRVHAVAGGAAREVLYSPDLFDFGANELGDSLEGIRGFAGARILYPLNSTEYKDELGAMLGASYFRLLGETMRYGLSARGLAIDTVGAGAEEFPVFRELYFETPDGADRLVVHALLDSPSVAGAYRLEIRPGADTVVDVELALYPRVDLPGAGIAPLTSMFQFAPNDRAGIDDFRAGVHDSDGLLMHTGAGEWIWRPVTNPATTQVSSFTDPGVRGFGLMQRERRFSGYQDLEARYERRPSAWVEPAGDWGPGKVVLLELNTENETNDNLVAFWQPDAPLAKGEETVLGYRLHWCLEVPDAAVGGGSPLRAVATRTGSGNRVGYDPEDDPDFGTRLFMIDFAGRDLPAPDAAVRAVVTVTNGEASTVTAEHNAPLDAWRAYVRVRADDGRPAGAPVEIRCFLQLGDAALSETWLYRWIP